MQRLLIGTEIEDWVQRVREELDLPVRLSLWTGHTFALGSFDTPAVEIRVRDAAALPLLLESSLDTLGEAYLKQHIDVEGNPADIVDVARRLSSLCGPRPAVVRRARALSSVEPNEHESVRYHYDVSNDFYKLWLDENMAYACAHFDRADESLETAQLNAIDRILVKIRLRPGQSLLDVDCGWGALAIRAAQRYDARCVGLTRSERQYQLATERVRAAGLSDRVEIRLANYRTLTGRFDRITSVCLGASVGARDLAGRFAKLQSLLADDGIVLTHTFTSMAADPGDAPAPGDPFAERYVFPTAHPPHLSFALRAMQQGGLESLDIENLRGHYARTLQCWVQRFEQNADRIRQAVGETKFRIWRVYLMGRVYTFSVGRASIYQIAGQKAGRPAASLRRPDASLQRPVVELPAATEPRPSRAPEPAHSNCTPADDAPLYARRPLRQVYPVDILPDADRNLDAGPRRCLAGGGSS